MGAGVEGSCALECNVQSLEESLGSPRGDVTGSVSQPT